MWGRLVTCGRLLIRLLIGLPKLLRNQQQGRWPSGIEFWTRLVIRSSGSRLRLWRTHQIHRRYVRRHRDGEEAEHHLIPALFAEMHFLRGIRIGGVIRRIVEVSDGFD